MILCRFKRFSSDIRLVKYDKYSYRVYIGRKKILDTFYLSYALEKFDTLVSNFYL